MEMSSWWRQTNEQTREYRANRHLKLSFANIVNKRLCKICVMIIYFSRPGGSDLIVWTLHVFPFVVLVDCSIVRFQFACWKFCCSFCLYVFQLFPVVLTFFLVCAVRTPQKHAEIRHGRWFEKLSNTSEKIFSVGRKSKLFKPWPWQCAAPGTRILGHIHQLARGFCLKVTIMSSTLLYNEIF